MTTLVFDIEATGAPVNKAHPWDVRNKACNIGILDTITTIHKLEYDEEPYGNALKKIQEAFNTATTVVGFNLKYDLAWLFRYGIRLPDNVRLFDCQVAFFILWGQEKSYPSLNEVAETLGCEVKLDIVKLEYWDNKIDTDKVPYDILCEYLEQDLIVTKQVYAKLQEKLAASSEKMKRLMSIAMQDLAVLHSIEANGLLLDVKKCKDKSLEIEQKIREIDDVFYKTFNAPWLNFNSGDHLSAILYGGVILLDGKEDYLFTYKDGRTTTKTRNIKVSHEFPRLFVPLERTELAKQGFYATNEPTLTALAMKAKGEAKHILDLLLKRAKLEKLVSTYFKGFPKKADANGWFDNVIHSSFNQCVARSGRLSSTGPNVQNIAEDVKEVIISRFKRKPK